MSGTAEDGLPLERWLFQTGTGMVKPPLRVVSFIRFNVAKSIPLYKVEVIYILKKTICSQLI